MSTLCSGLKFMMHANLMSVGGEGGDCGEGEGDNDGDCVEGDVFSDSMSTLCSELKSSLQVELMAVGGEGGDCGECEGDDADDCAEGHDAGPFCCRRRIMFQTCSHTSLSVI